MKRRDALDTLETLEGDLGLASLPVDALQVFCRFLGLPEAGNRAMVAGRLRKALQDRVAARALEQMELS